MTDELNETPGLYGILNFKIKIKVNNYDVMVVY